LRAIRNSLDLESAYQSVLERIKAQGGENARLGMAVRMWISYSKRPLHVDEISHAVAIRIGSNDPNSDEIPAISVRIFTKVPYLRQWYYTDGLDQDVLCLESV